MNTSTTAIVTGGASGIGAACVAALTARGVRVAVIDLPLQEARCRRLLGSAVLFVAANASKRSEIESAVSRASALLGVAVPDIVVATIGGNPHGLPRGTILEETAAHVLATVQMTLFSAYHIVEICARKMVALADARPRSFVLIGSVMANFARASAGAYTMSKVALCQFARTSAATLGPHAIRVNVVQPGWIDTPGERKFSTQEMMDGAARALPLRRMGRAADIGACVDFLTSDKASYITGQVLTVDGGYTVALDLPSTASVDIDVASKL